MKKFFRDFSEWLFSRLYGRDLRNSGHLERIFRNWPLMLVMSFSACITIYMLFLRPIIGMADNGDFLRVIHQNGIYKFGGEGASEDYFRYFIREYGLMQWFNENPISYFTTQSLFILIARILNTIFHSRAVFDIRFLGGVYTVLYLCAMFFALKATISKISNSIFALITAALVVFILNDVGYIAYFNSFYGEAVALICAVASVFCLILYSRGEGNDTFLLTAIFLAAFFLVTVKHQFAPIALLFSLIFVRIYFVKKEVVHRLICVVMSISIAASGIVTYLLIGEEFMYINQFHAMTRGVLLQAQNPEEALEEFGIDPQYSLLADVIYFDHNPMIDPSSQILIDNFYEHYSMFSVAAYYLRHPTRFLAMLEIAVDRSFALRPTAMGNFEEREGFAPGTLTQFFSGWGVFKLNNPPRNLGFISLLFLITLAIHLPEYIRSWRGGNHRKALFFEILLMVILMGLSQVVISIITAGDADIEKHVFLFNTSFDIMVIMLFCKLFETASEIYVNWRNKA